MTQLVRTVAVLMGSLAASSQMPLASTLEGSEASDLWASALMCTDST